MEVKPRQFRVAFQSDLVGRDDYIPVENVIVNTHSWFVFQGEFVILPDVAHHTSSIIGRPYTNMHYFKAGDNVEIAVSETVEQEVSEAILVGSNTNYYHFNIDYLANIFSSPASEKLAENVSILTDARLRWQRETLECLRLSLKNQNLPKFIKVKKLYIVRRAFDLWGKNLVKDYFARIRDRTKHLPPLQSENGRVFLSRQKSPCRRIRNIDSLSSLLDQHGFRQVVPDDTSVSDQIRIFRDAETVIAPHGAGLANIVYGPPGLSIIELMPGQSWRPKCFQMIANANDQRFHQSLGGGSFSDLEFDINIKHISDLLRDKGL